MLIFISLILVIIASLSPVPQHAFDKPDIIVCKDGYEIIYDNGDGTYDEYFICDSNAHTHLK